MNRPALIFCLVLVHPLLTFADRAAAERHYAQGNELFSKKDMPGAIQAFTRAIEEDPKWGAAWGMRGFAKYRDSNFTGAIEDLTIAIPLDPQRLEFRMYRVQTYLYLDRIQEALEAAEENNKLFPAETEVASQYGRALIRSGEVDRGLEIMEKAFAAGGRDVRMPPRADGYSRKADWAAMAAEAENAIAGGAPSTVLHFFRVVALTEGGQYDRAAQAVKDADTKRGIVAIMCRAWLSSTPQAGPHFNAESAVRDVAQLLESQNPEAFNCAARAYFLTGHVDRCLDLLSTRGRRTNFDTLFWLGAAYWKLGRLPEARQVLSDARRLNPYLSKHASRVEGLGDLLASLDRELAKEGEGPNRARLGHELATHLLSVAEIEALVRRYQFGRAASEYEKLLGSLTSAVRKAEVEQRLPEVRGMAGALAKLVAGVNNGRLKLKTKLGPSDLTIVKADDQLFDFTIPKGEGRFPWAYVDPSVFCDFALQAGLSPEETFGVACLAWDGGARETAVKLFEEAVKKKPALKTGLYAFVAKRRGTAATPFVLFRGAYVTPEEKANLEKGLVPWQGQWVTAADKENLSKGRIKVDGKWLPGKDAELIALGYRKHNGEWMSRDDYEALRSQWANAWIEETAHYTIRTNQGEGFARELAALAEAGHAEMKRFWGSEPKLPSGEKMTLFAFRSYEDYRKFCVDMKAESFLNASGFARSDSNTVAGWNKTTNEQQFLQTMVHEAAHLYYYRVAPAAKPASWHAEGLATYFEGFDWDGKSYRFGAASEGRLPFVRDAMKNNRHIVLGDLVKGDAIGLINSDTQKALLFYAECWSLNYYLTVTDNKVYREAYVAYRKAVESGKAAGLEEFFKDMGQMEKDWVQFVTGL